MKPIGRVHDGEEREIVQVPLSGGAVIEVMGERKVARILGPVPQQSKAEPEVEASLRELSQGDAEETRRGLANAVADKKSKCKHPINRRIGTGCGACGQENVKLTNRKSP